jgi:large conductance mechanosensitive channel
MSFFGEFRTFAMRGNVVDLAVGVVIGAAFGRIVSALVDGIIMPVVGLLVGGVHFGDLAFQLKAPAIAPDGSEVTPAVLFQYGAFLQTLLDFFIIALAIFVLIRLMNRMRRKEEAKPAPIAELSTEAKLLAEIRDALMAR